MKRFDPYWVLWQGMREKAAAYGTTIHRLFVDSMVRFKGMVFLVLAADAAGMFLQITAIGQAIYYAKRLERGTDFTLLGYTFAPRTSLTLLLLCAIGFVLTMLISAGICYFSRSKALTLSRRYEELCIKRVLRVMADGAASLNMPNAHGAGDVDMMRLIGSDARLCGRSFLRLMILVVPLLTFMSSLAVLLWINSLLSMFLILPAAFFLYLLLKANRLAASSFLGYERYAPGTAAEKRGILQRLKGLAAANGQTDRWIESYMASGQIRHNLDCYEQFLRTTELSHLINGILLSVGVFLILLILGWHAIAHNRQWSDLLIYLVAFKYSAGSMRQASANIIALSRFYPQVRRFFTFLDLNEVPEAIGCGMPEFEIRTKPVGTDGLAGGAARLEVKNGMRIGVISPLPLNRYNLVWILNRLSGRSPLAGSGSVWFATANYHCPSDVSLRASVGLDTRTDAETLLSELRDTAHYTAWHEELNAILDRPVPPDEWKQVRPGLKFLLGVKAARQVDPPVMIFDEKGLRGVPGMVKLRLLNLFSDRITLVVFHDSLSNMGKYEENTVAFVGNEGVTAMGEIRWAENNREQITRLLADSIAGMTPERETEEMKDDMDIMSML